MAEFVAAIDQGTTSTRCMIFDHDGAEVGRHQLEHEQILPKAGWVEHNPVEIWERTASVIDVGAQRDQAVVERSGRARASPISVRPRWSGTGIPAGRTTTRSSGRTPAPTASPRRWTATAAATSSGTRPACRPPPTSPAARCSGSWRTSTACAPTRSAATRSSARTDTWVLWNLTGGPRGGVHVTDVTNASRTMLMDLETLDWDDELLSFFGIPRRCCRRSSRRRRREPYGMTLRRPGPLGGEVPVTGILGDQQAAMVGPGVPGSRRGQEHLRHRQFPAAEHRREDRAVGERAADHGLLSVRRRQTRLRP